MPSRIMIMLFGGLIVCVTLSVVFEALAAIFGLAQFSGVYANALLWGVRLAALAVTIVLAIPAWQWIGRRSLWARLGLMVVSVGGAMALAVLGCFWYVFGEVDSDYSIITPDYVNARLGGLVLPPSARDTHLLIIQGQAMAMCLSVRLGKEEGERFLRELLVAWDIGDAAFMNKPPFGSPSSLCRKRWWKARDDLPWWYTKEDGHSTFVQFDEATGTMYIRFTSSG